MTKVIRIYQNLNIIQRIDGYLDASAMCNATGKRWGDYSRLDSSKAFIDALSADMQIPVTEIIQTVKGGPPQLQGTWIHPQAAIHLAQWCSPTFAVRVTKWVVDFFSGMLENKSIEIQAYAEYHKRMLRIFGITNAKLRMIALNKAIAKEFNIDLLETWGVESVNELRNSSKELRWEILEAVAHGASSPSEIEQALQGEYAAGYIRKLIVKLAKEGYLHRVEHGVYQLGEKAEIILEK